VGLETQVKQIQHGRTSPDADQARQRKEDPERDRGLGVSLEKDQRGNAPVTAPVGTVGWAPPPSPRVHLPALAGGTQLPPGVFHAFQ